MIYSASLLEEKLRENNVNILKEGLRTLRVKFDSKATKASLLSSLAQTLSY